VDDRRSGEFERLARLATQVLNEHFDNDGLCAACHGAVFPCQSAVLAEPNTALIR
jgi:hypothetical protein